MIAMRVIEAVPVAMPVLLAMPAVIMRIFVMLVIVGSGILVPLSGRVFVLVAVLEFTVAVGMGVDGGHEATVLPDGRSLAALTGLACARPVGYLHDCEGI
jgi:hypothetical protein